MISDVLNFNELFASVQALEVGAVSPVLADECGR